MLSNYEKNGAKGLRAVALVFIVIGCIAALIFIFFMLQLILGNNSERTQAVVVLAALLPAGTLMFFFAFASRALAAVADYAKRKLDEYDYASSDDESE
jgi:peptidoglycan biosynthesis protein MviN/MurJ (putative lipid II flippase)